MAKSGKCCKKRLKLGTAAIVVVLLALIRPTRVEAGVPVTLQNYETPVRKLRFSPDARELLTVGWKTDKLHRMVGLAEICRWNAVSGAQIAQTSVNAVCPRVVAISPNTEQVVLAGGELRPEGLETAGTVSLWNTRSGKKKRDFDGKQSVVTAAEFSPDGRWLAIGDITTGLSLWDLKDGRLIRSEKHKYGVSSIAFSSDGSQAISGSARGVILCGPGSDEIPWGDIKVLSPKEDAVAADLPDGEVPAFGGGVADTAIFPDGRFAAVASGNQIRFWDLQRKKLVGRVASQKNTDDPDVDLIRDVTSIAISPDGRLLASGCTCNFLDGKEHQVWIWEVVSGNPIAVFDGHRERIQDLAWSFDGQLLASTAGNVLTWDTHDVRHRGLRLQLQQRIKAHNYFFGSLAYSPNGKTIVTGAREGKVKLWDAATGRQTAEVDCRRQLDLDEVRTVDFLANGKAIVVAGGRQLQYGEAVVYHLESRKVIARMRGHDEPVESVSIASDGHTLVTASSDGKAILWDIASAKQLKTISGLKTNVTDVIVGLAPDGKLLATRFHPPQLWDLAAVRSLGEISATNSHIYCLAFLSNGRNLISGDAEGTLGLWDVATRQRLAVQHWHWWNVQCIALSPDERFVAAAGESRVKIFDPAFPWRHGMFSADDWPTVECPGRLLDLKLSPLGDQLAVASQGGDLILWKVVELKAKDAAIDLPEAYEALADSDAAKAYRAMRVLLAAGRPALVLLERKLAARDEVANPQTVAQLVTDLDDDRFAVRETATKQLIQLGTLAKAQLQAEWKRSRSTEVRARIALILDAVKPISPIAASPEKLHEIRARYVLSGLRSRDESVESSR